ncbi:phosphotransferase family protein [Falsiroseomonas sp. CW058]|uniref:phosphotransferase family protein n=1 Tax=Falsiroseomonas sp. CW058 TaxID=3388664 RepID=UPI003D31A6C9
MTDNDPGRMDLPLLRDALEAVRSDRPEAAAEALGRAFDVEDGAALLHSESRLLALAEERLFASDWPAAHALHEILHALGRTAHEWLRTRLDWRVRHLPRFRATFEAQPALARLGTVLAARLGRPVTSVASTRLRPGYIGVALFRHEVAFADGGAPLVLIEKVMSDERRDRRRIDHEHLLFTNVPPARLLAPAYFGTVADGPFVSVLSGFAEGDPLPLDRWVATHGELLHHYWAIAPEGALLRGPNVAENYRARLRDVIARQLPREVTDRLRGVTAEDASIALARRFTAISDTIDAMPLFVLHDDLHCGNILVDGQGGMSVIDWDNWALAPLGSGWRFHTTEDEVPAPDLARLHAARPLPPGVMPRDILLMAALWGHHKALRDGKHELAARWLEKILRFG